MTEPTPLPRPYGKYELLEHLGTGGMAEVYRARMPGIQGFEKIVVIKRILPGLATRGRVNAMFVEEARLAARVQHRNVVQVFELGQVGEELYMAMEFVEGTDLSKLLRGSVSRKLRLPVWLSVHIISEILAGLSYAHQLKDERGRPLEIVHRDVSPSNVFLSFQGDVKLGDFGVARSRMSEDATRAGELKGKVAYMAPEQLNGLHLDGRADVFAAGVVLWECLAQRRLFGGRPEFKTMAMIASAPREPPSKFAADVPPELDRIVLDALEIDRERRISSAAEMLNRLSSLPPPLSQRVPPGRVQRIVDVLIGRAEPSDEDVRDESLKLSALPMRASTATPTGTPSAVAHFASTPPLPGLSADLVMDPPAPSGPEPELVLAFEEKVEAAPREVLPRNSSWLFGEDEKAEMRVTSSTDRRADTLFESPPWQAIGALHVPTGQGEHPESYDGGYRGPLPFWIRHENGMVWGPIEWKKLKSTLDVDGPRDTARYYVAGHETQWADHEVVAQLIGHERWLRSEALPGSRLVGTLEKRSLSALFGQLWAAGATGRLVLLGDATDGPTRREIHLVQGAPVYISTDHPRLQLTDLMVRHQVIKPESVPQIVRDALAQLIPFEDAAIPHASMDMESGYALVMRDRAAELFGWRKGHFAFDTDYTPLRARAIARSLIPLTKQCVGRAKNDEELLELVKPYLNTPLTPTDRTGAGMRDMNLSGDQAIAARNLARGTPLATLIKREGQPRTYLVLAYTLVETGLLTPSSV
ncbi:MAG: serine/threonine-protein kinase [Myxococcota bacterium]